MSIIVFFRWLDFNVFLRWLDFAFLSAGAESVFLPNIVYLSFSSIARLHPIFILETLQDDEFFFVFFQMIITSQKVFPRVLRTTTSVFSGKRNAAYTTQRLVTKRL